MKRSRLDLEASLASAERQWIGLHTFVQEQANGSFRGWLWRGRELSAGEGRPMQHRIAHVGRNRASGGYIIVQCSAEAMPTTQVYSTDSEIVGWIYRTFGPEASAAVNASINAAINANTAVTA